MNLISINLESNRLSLLFYILYHGCPHVGLIFFNVVAHDMEQQVIVLI